jgi:hypothetical protein
VLKATTGPVAVNVMLDQQEVERLLSYVTDLRAEAA